MGLGVMTLSSLSPSAASTFAPNWVSQSLGMEELVANQVLATPNGDLLLAAWDRALWHVDNPNIFPTDSAPYYLPPTSNTPAINDCWAMDWASSDPDTIVAILSNQNHNQNLSAVSADGGLTWTRFAADVTEPATGTAAGCVAASTPLNWVIQPAQNSVITYGPMYTTNGGASWTACTFNDTTDYTQMHYAYFLRRHIVCADRVAANTFYIFHQPTRLVYRSTDSGANFIKMNSTALATGGLSVFNAKMKTVIGKEGHLWWTGGPAGSLADYQTPAGIFTRSVDGGATWTTVGDVLEVMDFAFGKEAPGASYPTLFIAGWVNSVYGIYMSTDVSDTPAALSWTKIGAWPAGLIDNITCVEADKLRFGRAYFGFVGNGFAYTDGAVEGQTRFRITTS